MEAASLYSLIPDVELVSCEQDATMIDTLQRQATLPGINGNKSHIAVGTIDMRYFWEVVHIGQLHACNDNDFSSVAFST